MPRRSWIKLAGEAGLEPATSSLTGRRCYQLSYSPAAGCRLDNRLELAWMDPLGDRPRRAGLSRRRRRLSYGGHGPLPPKVDRRSGELRRILPPCRRSGHLAPRRMQGMWCPVTGSNRRHPVCRTGALPAELTGRGGGASGGRCREHRDKTTPQATPGDLLDAIEALVPTELWPLENGSRPGY